MQADGTRRSRELDEGTRTCHLNCERARGPRTDGLLRVDYTVVAEQSFLALTAVCASLRDRPMTEEEGEQQPAAGAAPGWH